MNIITQEAKKRQAVVEYANKNNKSKASRQYGVSLNVGVKGMTAHGSPLRKNRIDRTATPKGIQKKKKDK